MSSDKTQQVIKRKYRPEIDGLRTFAVTTVIINHFNKDILPGGYLGVDIFFVISGYVISSSLDSRPEERFFDFIVGFYERRVKRIFPVLLICILITATLAFLFIPEPQVVARTAIASIFGFSNLYFYQNSTAYFSLESDLNLFTQTWSLGIEEQFYLLFPLLVWFSGFSRSRPYATRAYPLQWYVLQCHQLFYLHVYIQLINLQFTFLLPSRFWDCSWMPYLYTSKERNQNWQMSSPAVSNLCHNPNCRDAVLAS